MKTIIYYFTGTGNSLAAAGKIAAALGDCELVPIASLMNGSGPVVPAADRVGIVCPVYDAGVPRMVAEFAARLDLSRSGYTFAVITFGGMGVSALHQLNAIFKERQGTGLDAAFSVKMPGNFPPVGRPPVGEKKEKVLKDADARLADIAEKIDKGLNVAPGFSPVSTVFHRLLYSPFYNNVREGDKAFSVSDACTSCGTCAKVCPAGNIRMEDGRPVWLHNCELCCACLHFCPAEAIDLNMMRGTKGRGRYRHPDVTVEDMKFQQGERPATTH